MWYLINNKTGHVYYLVAAAAGHTVGRANTDLVIQNDDSISRQHAMLQPDKNVLKLTDTGSRYGTYVNGNIATCVPVSKVQPTELTDGDTVQFGRCGSVWTVRTVHFRCLTSTLTMSSELKAVLQKLRAELLPAYARDLSHLIMPTITVTTKLLLCLVGQVPVVSPEYFAAVDASIAQGKGLPPVIEFIPDCTETDIKNDARMFQPNPARRNLFNGKEFIFLSTTQCKQYEDIVQLAGGVCLCVQREKIAKTRFVNPNVVTIKLKELSSSQSQSVDSLQQRFTARGLRMIPEVEIGLAILYSSTEKYCNPAYNFAFNVEVCAEPKPVETEDVLAKNSMNTENTNPPKKARMELDTIPETEPNTERPQTATASSGAVKHPVSDADQPGVSNCRRSKRFSESAPKGKQDQEAEKDKDSYQEPKRPRRACAISSTKVISTTKVTTASKQTAVPNGATPVAPDPNTIPPADSAPRTEPSQLFSSAGFQAVIRNPEVSVESNTAASDSRPASRRRANALFRAEDDDLFNFDFIAPRKKPKTAGPSVANGSSASTVNQTPNQDANDLFSLDDNLPSQRRRGTNRRTGNDRPPSTTADAAEGTSGSDRNSKDTRDSASSMSQTSRYGNNSLSSRFREFIKPIELSTAGWLSSTMCNLKLEANDDDKSTSVKIKQEPLDSVDGKDAKDKLWLGGMLDIFQVVEKSMKLEVHLSSTREGSVEHERSRALPEGVRNQKAFVKKRHYPVQQAGFASKLMCSVDESQAA